MNKGELIEAVQAAAGLSTKREAQDAVEAFLSTVVGTLKKGGDVAIAGFGTFSTSRRAARMGRNPQTGEQIKIKASTVVKFKAGKAFKEAVN